MKHINYYRFFFSSIIIISLFNLYMSQELIRAIMFGQLERVQSLIYNGAQINMIDKSGWTPLTYACDSSSRNNIDIIKLLLNKHANINSPNSSGNTPLSYACKKGNLKIVKLLLDNGAINNINSMDIDGKTPLSYACEYDSFDIVKLLLDNGAQESINSTEHLFWSPLNSAFRNNNLEIIKLLIEKGVNIINISYILDNSRNIKLKKNILLFFIFYNYNKIEEISKKLEQFIIKLNINIDIIINLLENKQQQLLRYKRQQFLTFMQSIKDLNGDSKINLFFKTSNGFSKEYWKRHITSFLGEQEIKEEIKFILVFPMEILELI